MKKTTGFLLSGGGVLAGLLLGNWWQASTALLVAAAVLSTTLLLVGWRILLLKRAAIGILFGLLGLGYSLLWQARMAASVPWEESVMIRAEVVSCRPSFRHFRCSVDSHNPPARLSATLEQNLRSGRLVVLTGRVTPLPPHLQHLHGDGVVAQLAEATLQHYQERPYAWRSVLSRLKDRCEAILSRALTEPASSLSQGLLFGSRQNFTDDFAEALRRTNTVHIVAVSGFNITFVAGFVKHLLYRFSQRTVLAASSTIIVGFVAMIGAPASAVRAAIMGVLLLLERVIGRKIYIPSLVVLTALCMALPNPWILRYDLGFQLSFLAFVGLVALAPRIERRLMWLVPPIRSIAASTLGATVMTLPLLVPLSGQVSLVGPLANLLVVPLIPLVMLLAAIVLVAGFLSLPLSRLIGTLLYLPSLAIVTVIETAGSLPLATLPWVWGLPLVVLLGGLTILLRRRRAT